MQEVKLTKGYVTLIDDEDLERVCRFQWRTLPTRGKLYAVRDLCEAGKRIKQKLHRFILGITDPCAYDRSAVEHFGEFAHCNFARTD